MSDRFFAPAPWPLRVMLPEAEGHHLARVLRGAVGDEVEIFDGSGRSAQAVVVSIRKQSVEVEVRSPIQDDAVPPCELILAVAFPKGERLRWMIEKVTELGIDRLIPLSTQRSVVEPSDQKLHKVEQMVVAACKQSGRNRLLVIEPICALADLNRRLDCESAVVRFGCPLLSANSTGIGKINYSKSRVVAVIGPEGGLTSEEEALLRSWGAAPMTLAPHVLRIETAAVAFAAVLSAGRQPGMSGDF